MNNYTCLVCRKEKLDKNTIGINKKLLGLNVSQFYCIDCLAEFLNVEKQDILDKIEEFKSEGCKLFN